MSSIYPTNSTSEEEVDGISVGEGVLSFRTQLSRDNTEKPSRFPRAVHRAGLPNTMGSTSSPMQEKRELDEALRQLTMLDNFTTVVHQQAGGTIHRKEPSGAEIEGDSKQHVREQLGCLRDKLQQREGEVEVLKRTFEEGWCRERKLFERICQLESFITTNHSGSVDQIGTAEEYRRSRDAFWDQETFTADSQAEIGSDPVIIEKLNLAYEDLTAIYDLRVDIDHQLNELHDGLVNPAMRKQIIKIVREKELKLRSQRFTK